MRENIQFLNSKTKKIIPYVEESLSILESLNLTVTENVMFHVCSPSHPGALGQTHHYSSKNKYVITISPKIIDDKDECTNTIIHELLHVKSKGKGINRGHGKWWNRLANLVSYSSKYNIARYAEVPPVKESNSFFRLSKEKQKLLFEKMKEENNPELLEKFHSIYFSLIDNNQKEEYTFYYIENKIIRNKDLPYLPVKDLFPSIAVNDRVRWGLVNRYLTGQYDDVLDTPSKSSRFHYLFSLPFNGDDPDNVLDAFKRYQALNIVKNHTESRFSSI